MNEGPKVVDIQRQLEESLTCLPDLALPPELEGLRHLPLDGFRPKVSVYYPANGNRKRRKVRETASASYFDGNTCEIVIGFEPIGESAEGSVQPPTIRQVSDVTAVAYNPGVPTVEEDPPDTMAALIDELLDAESRRPFVGLTWFRDQVLAQDSAHPWAKEPDMVRSLLNKAIDDRIIRTSKVPNPNTPMYPTTAIRLNRAHPRYRGDEPHRVRRFNPIRIRGGPISDTVIEDRADRV